MADTSFDVIVIGGGPGGYVAAIRAAQLGMKAAVVEREHLGGICLNWGCIPTKALLRSCEISHLLRHLGDYGFSAKDIIIATGARARALPGLEPDGKLVWTYKEAMVPPAMPKSLLVIGSGAIGIEFASFYRNMGAEVTVVEVLDRVLPVEDEEISAFARKVFEKQGMKIHTGATVKALKKGADDVTATVEAAGKSFEIKADRVVLAIGIVGNVEHLGLEGTKVKVEKTHIVADQ